MIVVQGAFYDPAFGAGLKANGSVPPIIYERYLSPAQLAVGGDAHLNTARQCFTEKHQ
jgi:hypothetical protein